MADFHRLQITSTTVGGRSARVRLDDKELVATHVSLEMSTGDLTVATIRFPVTIDLDVMVADDELRFLG